MSEVMSRRVAVVLMNLGGPDSPEAVQPFLFNLFSDPAIMEVPGPLRWILARLISRRRAPFARENYARIGGASPLLANTEAQATALQTALAEVGEVKVFIAMRYWHPLTEATVRDVVAFRPDEVVLLPLYPQFSGTTSGSSLRRWSAAAQKAGLSVTTRILCCYPTQAGFVAAAAALIERGLEEAIARGQPRLLLSAHGLPKRTVARGDPYEIHVVQSAGAIMQALRQRDPRWHGLEHVVCYQSRVGPLEWLGPYTGAEIERAAADKRAVVVFPIAFVSEHSETLVELDIDYRHLAEAAGAPAYIRVPAVGTQPAFVEGLASMVRNALQQPAVTASDSGLRLCPAAFGRCAMGATNA
ncbi:MAG: ferrochelatase [Alphaproteobacteria bacterium]|nr:ferrochelatase [Alphaproteobacteria bacterium]